MNFKLITSILIFALLSTSVMAAPNLPTKQDIITFLDGVPTDNGNFIKNASNMSKTEHPNWNWDIWTTNSTKMISFYYNNSSSAKGYSSLYYDEAGKYMNHLCYINLTLVESYPANNSISDNKSNTDENNTNDNISCNITNNSKENITNQTNNTTQTNNTIKTNNTTESKSGNVGSSIDINVNNYTSGTSANFSVKTNNQISTNQIEELIESIRHLFNAIFGAN